FFRVLSKNGRGLFVVLKGQFLGQNVVFLVFHLLFQMTDHLFTLVSRGCITLSRDLSRMVFTLRLLKGAQDT
ncbi:hypothetical protein, partial [Klebsiella pneumoniae]|uniref:hypothetical protein n=1 Tax=Klebsiella pneumoniae TaxID=573 RepID=UPI001F4B8A6F